MDTKLANLEQYLLREEGPDELIRTAVAHYQFEAIHPLDDGNGRTGRILNIVYLGTLEAMGMLQSEMVGRERIFVSVPLMNLLTEGSL